MHRQHKLIRKGTILYDKVARNYFYYDPDVDDEMIEKQPMRFDVVNYSDVPQGRTIRQYKGRRPGDDLNKLKKPG